MNPISQAVASFTQSIESPRFAAELARARAERPELAPYASPAEVLAALGRESALSRAEQDALIVVIVAEHQRARHVLWQSILLATYEGMIHNVAKRTLGVAKDDARQGALSGFLSALASMKLTCQRSERSDELGAGSGTTEAKPREDTKTDSPPDLLSLWLRQRTERVAFAQACFTEEPNAEPVGRRERDPEDLEARIEIDDQMNRLVRELVRLFGDGAAVHEILDVLLYSRTESGQLLEYVDEKYVGYTRAQRDRIYDRLSGMRHGALKRLERVFGGDDGLFAVLDAA